MKRLLVFAFVFLLPSAFAEMSHSPKEVSEGEEFIAWIDERLPVSNFVKNHLSEYYAPKNFNFFYFFGSLALFVFIMQIITGIFLTINYKPDAASAFASVEYIMRDVEWGWLIRYMHSTCLLYTSPSPRDRG